MRKRARNLLDKLRQNRRGWSESNLAYLLLEVGFDRREGRKHPVYTHPHHPGIVNEVLGRGYYNYTIPSRRDLPPAYAREVLALVEEALKREGSDGED